MKNENETIENSEEHAAVEEALKELQSEAEAIDEKEQTLEAASEEVEEEEAKDKLTEETAEEEKSSEVSEETEVSDEAEASEENVEEDDIDTHIQNLKKNDAAKLLVKKARIIVDEAETQLEQCKVLLENDLKDYNQAKQDLLEHGLEESESLLNELGYKGEEESIELDEDVVTFEPKKEVEPIVIKEISGGGFGSFILGLIAAFLTAVGMVYLATQKLGITLDVSQVPTTATLKPILKWYSSLVGLPGSTTIGYVVIGVAAFLVFYIVYKIRVSMRASSNLAMAKEQLAAAEEYSTQKGTCKEEMDKVDAYIQEAIVTLKTYKVILHEQRAKLARILHLENEKIENADFHHKSQTELKDTYELITTIKDFMSVPMSEEGKLSEKSSLFLSRAKSRIQKVIDRLY